MFTYLAAYPEAMKRLQEEIDSRAEGEFAGENDFLEACMFESLRLQPVVPCGLSRVTPPVGGGLVLDNGTFLPGGVNIFFPNVRGVP